jgi:hypothetical protein
MTQRSVVCDVTGDPVGFFVAFVSISATFLERRTTGYGVGCSLEDGPSVAGERKPSVRWPLGVSPAGELCGKSLSQERRSAL